MQIKTLNYPDFKAAWDLNVTAFTESFKRSPSEAEQNANFPIHKKGDFIVGAFTDDAHLAGIAFANLQHTKYVISNLYIEWRLRRNGLGRAILRHTLDAIDTSTAARECQIYVRRDNTAAVALYSAFHFAKAYEWKDGVILMSRAKPEDTEALAL